MPLKKRSRYFDNRGQVLIFSLLMIPVISISFFQTLRISRFVERKIALQNGLDAALLSGATLLALGLNHISHLNKKLIRYHELLLLVKAGSVIHGGRGLLLTQELIKKRIQMIAKHQDFIKSTYPFRAVKEVYVIARKNSTPHFVLYPPVLQFSIQRKESMDGLPGPYELTQERDLHWTISGTYYRGSYFAKSKILVAGTDLITSNWRGIFVE